MVEVHAALLAFELTAARGLAYDGFGNEALAGLGRGM